MARYIREVELNRPDDFVQYIMTDFLSKHRFKLVEFEGEMVYRTGDGFFEIPKFLTWGYQNGIFHVEAWTRNCWFPGVYGQENALTGFMGCIPKEAYKKDIEALLGLLFQPIYANEPITEGGQQATPVMGANQGMNVQKPVYVKGTDVSRYAVMALAFSIVGLLLGCLNVFASIFFGCLGIVYGKKSMNSEKKGMATAGFVIGIVAVVLSVVLFIINVAALVM